MLVLVAEVRHDLSSIRVEDAASVGETGRCQVYLERTHAGLHRKKGLVEVGVVRRLYVEGADVSLDYGNLGGLARGDVDGLVAQAVASVGHVQTPQLDGGNSAFVVQHQLSPAHRVHWFAPLVARVSELQLARHLHRRRHRNAPVSRR